MTSEKIELMSKVLSSFSLITGIMCLYYLQATWSELMKFDAIEYLRKKKISFDSYQLTFLGKHRLFDESSTNYSMFRYLLAANLIALVLRYIISP